MKKLFPALLLFSLLAGCAPRVTLLPFASPTPDASLHTPTPRPTLAATSTPEPGSQLGVGADALQGVTVTLWHGFGGREASLLAQLSAEFNLTNPWGITVEPVSQANFNQLVSQVDASFNHSTTPDLVIGLSEHALHWDADGHIVALGLYVNNPEYGLPGADLADIPAVFLAQDEVDGRQLAFPMLRSGRFIFYNQTWARELGFPSAPKTSDEFRQQACAANGVFRSDADLTNDGLGGWVVDGDPYTGYGWMAASGGVVYENGTYTFGRDENLQAVTFLKELRDDGCAWVSASNSNYEHLTARRALFATGNLADIFEQANTFRAAGATDQWTVIPFPGDTQVVPAYGVSYMLLESSQPRQLAAWLFVRWMTSAEVQARLVEDTGWLPARSSALELVPAFHQQNPQWSAASKLIPVMVTHPQAASWRTARLVLGDGFVYIFRLNLPVEDLPGVLDQMDETAQDLQP